MSRSENEITSDQSWIINVSFYFCSISKIIICCFFFQISAKEVPADYVHPKAKWLLQPSLPWLWRELQGKGKQKTKQNDTSLGFVCNFQIGPAGVAQEGTFSTSGPFEGERGFPLTSHLRAFITWMTQCAGASRGFSFFTVWRAVGRHLCM